MNMAKVTTREVKTNVSKGMKKSLAGEEVMITKGNEHLILDSRAEKFSRRLGGAKNIIKTMPQDFNAPLEDFKDYM